MKVLIAMFCLLATTSALAQKDCSTAKDPAKCQARVDAKAAQEAKRKAAQLTCMPQAEAHRACIRHEMCAGTADPAACEAKVGKK